MICLIGTCHLAVPSNFAPTTFPLVLIFLWRHKSITVMPRITLGQKSRMGCRECKTRKVKCDEQRPIYGSCSKFNKRCSFLRTTPYLWGLGLSNEQIKRGKSISAQKPERDAGEGSSKHAKDNPGYTLDDMRLLHHLTSCISTTMSDGVEAHQKWAPTVVQIAFAQNFLLQGILALAALHMASLKTDD
jgi:hypothetical protein